MREAFGVAGFLWEVKVPRVEGGRGRGFAFVGFTTRLEAERAIALVNGKVPPLRTIAPDF